MKEMSLGQVYQMIAEKNQETGDKNAWVDAESNTVWMLGSEGELLRFYGGKAILANMSEQEINEFVATVTALLNEEEGGNLTVISGLAQSESKDVPYIP